jgi:hypothetical protein
LQVVAGGCRWLQVVAGGCRWLQVVAGGCRCLQVFAGVCRCLQVFVGGCKWLQVVVGVCRCWQVVAGGCRWLLSWFDVACVAFIYTQAFSLFYSCLTLHCSIKVLQISRKWLLNVFEFKIMLSYYVH